MPAEPFATALLFAVFAVLVVASVVFSRAFERTGIPLVLVFLAIGMLAGSEGIGGIAFDDYRFAFRIGTAALVFILFDGGLNTPIEAVRRVWAPAGVLATVGVAGTAALTAAGARLLGFTWPQAFLLGAVVSSTDAAAVFAGLRSHGIGLRRRVGSTLEVESGLNDPMAVILTIALTGLLVGKTPPSIPWFALHVIAQLFIGATVGGVTGWLASRSLVWLRLRALGLYPVVTLAVALLSFGVTTLLNGSGFLAVYAAGLVLGNGYIPYRPGVLRTHDALAWLSQIVMFLVFGLLVFPSQLPAVAVPGLLLAAMLAFIARPVLALACLLPFKYSVREAGYIGWVGLRGAVPIVLAIFPVLERAPGAHLIFNLVFFVVVVTTILPGATVAQATRIFGLDVDEPPRPHAVLELESMVPVKGELMAFFVDEALAVAGASLAELPFPEGAAAALVLRGDEMIPPKGSTVLMPGDFVYVFARKEDRHFMMLMFGRPEEE
ncbi:MAG TPA: potassium/proton antiporter [Gemmatimonadaceae bacterium]|nr:potassium/proton antiporter [Gemmatimonadaceae bacterium]